jgi:hypothetical protein
MSAVLKNLFLNKIQPRFANVMGALASKIAEIIPLLLAQLCLSVCPYVTTPEQTNVS